MWFTAHECVNFNDEVQSLHHPIMNDLPLKRPKMKPPGLALNLGGTYSCSFGGKD